MTLGLSGFVPSAFINPINTPGWTIGSLFVLYAIFPFTCRMLKAASPRFRLYVLVPFFFLCSNAKPLADQSVNLGILSGLVRLAALSSIPDFLQGVNVGLLFLEHDWKKHPVFLQKIGMSAAIAAAVCLFIFVDLAKQPMWIQLWRAYGMMQPIWFTMVWYAARGKDILSYLFELPMVSYMGNTSFGVYIMQQLLIDYKWQNDPFLQEHKYPKVFEFILLLTIMGALGYHFIQLPFNPYVMGSGTTMLKKYRASRYSKWVTRGIQIGLESFIARTITAAVFAVAYVFYVNFQPCYEVNMSYADGRMGTHKWFNLNDWKWLVNWYAVPCTNRRLVPEPAAQVLYLTVAISLVLSSASIVSALTSGVVRWRNRGQAEQEADSDADLTDTAVVVRVVVDRARDEASLIKETLDRAIKSIDSLKDQRKVALELLGSDNAFEYQPPSDSVEMLTIPMPFEMAKSRSQTQPKDLLLTIPVGTKLDSGEQILQLMRHYRAGTVTAVPLAIDGGYDALPSLGTLAELNPLHPHKFPAALVGCSSAQSHLLHRNLESSGGSLARLVLVTQLFSEAFLHFAFFLSILLLLTTPVHEHYTKGLYCNYYWTTVCTNGTPSGFFVGRLLITILAALYSAAYFYRFLSFFRASEGGFVREIILTFLLLLFLPLTAVMETVTCLGLAVRSLVPHWDGEMDSDSNSITSEVVNSPTKQA